MRIHERSTILRYTTYILITRKLVSLTWRTPTIRYTCLLDELKNIKYLHTKKDRNNTHPMPVVPETIREYPKYIFRRHSVYSASADSKQSVVPKATRLRLEL